MYGLEQCCRRGLGLLLLLMLPALASAHDSTAGHGGHELIDFSLTTDQGEWQLNSLRGKVVFVVFGYTHCPDVCPTSLQTLADAFDQLEPELQDQARGVFVSLDPERDGHDKLRQYARYFHPNIIGVTGTAAEVRSVADELGVRFKINNPGSEDYSVDHSTLAFAIDPQGDKLMVLVSHAAPASFIAQLVRDTLQPDVADSNTEASGS
ncbi:MAG: SCO family protein [Halopseudomonas sp.]